MGVMLESEDHQDRSMPLLFTEEAKTGRLERIVGDLMGELGLDLTDQHFACTPARVARLYRELTRGARVDPAAGWLLLPYLIWVSYATALNFSIWRLNV
jgi:GTP cyclohydrolase I